MLEGLMVGVSCLAGEGAGVQLALTDWRTGWTFGFGAVGGGVGFGDVGGGVPWTRFTSAREKQDTP